MTAPARSVAAAGDAWRAAAAIAVLAGAVRLAWGLAAGVVPGAGGFDDAAWYHLTASGLARGAGYANPLSGQPTAAWPPGYPFALAAAYRAFGASPATAVALNAAAGALTCLLVWGLGRRLVGPRGGLVAAALLAAFPSHVLFAGVVLSETLFTCLAVALVLAAVALVVRDAGPVAWLAWGVGLGLAALVRAEALVLTLVPAAAVLGPRRRGAAPVLAATIAGAALALAPWTARNARLFDALVPTSTGFGRTLWIGHNPDAAGGMRPALQEAQARAMAEAGVAPVGPAGELATDRFLLHDALAFARAHPGRELRLTAARVYHLFRGDHVWQSWYPPGTPRGLASETARRWLGRLSDAYYAAVGLLAVAAWVRRRPADGWRVVDGALVAWVAVFALVYGDPRFHHMPMALACVLAAATLESFRRGGDADAAPAR